MNYREVLPALSSIVITILLLAGVALSDLDVSGGEGIKAQYHGFDGVSFQPIDAQAKQSVGLNTREGIIK